MKSFGSDTHAPPLVSVAPRPCNTLVLQVTPSRRDYWKRMRRNSRLSAVMGAEPVTMKRMRSKPSVSFTPLNTSLS